MTFPIRRYPLDPTGQSINNFVSNEEHILGPKTGPYHPIAPYYGPFYNSPMSLRVYRDATLLTSGIDYWAVNLIQEGTAEFNGEVCEVLVLKGMAEGDTIRLNYQNLGGLFQNHAKGLIDLYNAYLVDNRPIDWVTGIKNLPDTFKPSYHLHMLSDVVGWEALIVAIERMINAITLQNVPAFEALIDWVNVRFDSFTQTYSQVCLAGNTTVGIGQTLEIKITNFETYQTYLITSNKVTVNRIDDILFVTGVVEGNDAWLKVNNSNFPLSVSA